MSQLPRRPSTAALRHAASVCGTALGAAQPAAALATASGQGAEFMPLACAVIVQRA